MKSAKLKGETEGLIVAAQDQSLPTGNYQANIIKTDQTQHVHCANEKIKSIDHLMSGCPIVTLIEYKEKYNKIGH